MLQFIGFMLLIIGSVYPLSLQAQPRIHHDAIVIRQGLSYRGDQLFTGVTYSLWENDSIRIERTWRNGVLHGPINEYYKTGILAKVSMYQNNELTGEGLEYYPDGTLSRRIYYQLHLPSGRYEAFFPNGQLQIKGVMKNGLWNGPYEEYYPNGQLKIKSTRIQDGWEGSYEEYLESGALLLKGRYRNGVFKKSRGE